MASVTRIVMIRHGESAAQVSGLVAGHESCVGLSDTGRDQARRLARRLADSNEIDAVDAVYTSLLRRAQETSDAISRATNWPKPHTECHWCEIHPGAAEGLTWAEMRERFPSAGDPDDPIARRLPGMETWAEMYERVGRALLDLALTHEGGTIVVVTSGGPIGASFVALDGAGLRDGITFARATINTSITEWHHDGRTWSLQRHNDATHLDTP